MKIFTFSFFVLLAFGAITPEHSTQYTPSINLTNQDSIINWLTWQEYIELNQVEERKVLLNVYTEWCYWCKRMDESTYQQTDIINYINDNFYPVKFDAEQKEEIEFNEKVYQYVKSGKRGYHELAAELLNGRLSFPTLVFLNEEMEVIQSIVGYKTPVQFEQIVTYFAEDHYRKVPWVTYKKTYKSILVSE